MSYIYKDVKRTMREVVGIECSKCNKTVYADEDLEFQEIMHYKTVGGYGSVWGDGATVEISLCQYCVHALFKDFATIHNNF